MSPVDPPIAPRAEDPDSLYREIRGCRICRERPAGPPLPVEPNPVLAISPTARLVVAGQAPGNLADKTTKPFNDPSGVRLRAWMGVSDEIFYDPGRVAILPMGFCFPGYDVKGGDRPPRPECRRTWHERVMRAMPQVELILAIGGYAQRFHVRDAGRRGSARASLTETVADWRRVLEEGGVFAPVLPLPHPSWRNNAWLKRHPWFETDLLPVLRERVADLV